MDDQNYKAALDLLIKSMMNDYEGNKTANHAVRLTLGPTPQVLIDQGFPELPLGIDGSVVDKAFFDHGIPKSMLGRLYTLIATPKAIYRAHQGNPGSVVVTYEMKGASPIVVPIHPNKQKARNVFFNMVASVYGKTSNDGQSIEVRWRNEGLLLWEAPVAVGASASEVTQGAGTVESQAAEKKAA